MALDTVNLALLVSLYACLTEGMAVTEAVMKTESVFGADCTLECTAKSIPHVQYRAVRWYKVREPPSSRLSGILTKDLPNGTVRWYTGLEREVELLGDSRDILLPNVTCSDSGVYMCHLAAPVGEQNQEGQVLLTVTGCPTDSPSENLMTESLLVIFAAVVLMFALLIFLISYGSLKAILRDSNRTIKKETLLLDAPLKPLGKKDLQLIYTLGPKVSKTPMMKHICI